MSKHKHQPPPEVFQPFRAPAVDFGNFALAIARYAPKCSDSTRDHLRDLSARIMRDLKGQQKTSLVVFMLPGSLYRDMLNAVLAENVPTCLGLKLHKALRRGTKPWWGDGKAKVVEELPTLAFVLEAEQESSRSVTVPEDGDWNAEDEQ